MAATMTRSSGSSPSKKAKSGTGDQVTKRYVTDDTGVCVYVGVGGLGGGLGRGVLRVCLQPKRNS